MIQDNLVADPDPASAHDGFCRRVSELNDFIIARETQLRSAVLERDMLNAAIASFERESGSSTPQVTNRSFPPYPPTEQSAPRS